MIPGEFKKFLQKKKSPTQHFHSYDVGLVMVLGSIEKALILGFISTCVEINEHQGKLRHDGKFWARIPLKNFGVRSRTEPKETTHVGLYPYMKKQSVSRWLSQLETDKWIHSKLITKFNNHNLDKTKCFTLGPQFYLYQRQLAHLINEVQVERAFINNSPPIPPMSQNGTTVSPQVSMSQNGTPTSQNGTYNSISLLHPTPPHSPVGEEGGPSEEKPGTEIPVGELKKKGKKRYQQKREEIKPLLEKKHQDTDQIPVEESEFSKPLGSNIVQLMSQAFSETETEVEHVLRLSKCQGLIPEIERHFQGYVDRTLPNGSERTRETWKPYRSNLRSYLFQKHFQHEAWTHENLDHMIKKNRPQSQTPQRSQQHIKPRSLKDLQQRNS